MRSRARPWFADWRWETACNAYLYAGMRPIGNGWFVTPEGNFVGIAPGWSTRIAID